MERQSEVILNEQKETGGDQSFLNSAMVGYLTVAVGSIFLTQAAFEEV
jgi:hypothetical protein